MTTTETDPAAMLPVPIDDLADDLETFRLAKAEIEKWKAVQTAAREKIVERVGEAEFGTVGGRTAVKMPHRTVTRLDTPKLRADLGDDMLRAQGYLKETVERRFEVQD